MLAFEVGRNVHGYLSKIEKQLILGNILKHQKFSDVVIFGDNDSNQCVIPKNVQQKRVKRVVLGWHHSALLFEDGTAVIFGNNRNNKCDIPKNVQHKRVKRVVLGAYHSALLFED